MKWSPRTLNTKEPYPETQVQWQSFSAVHFSSPAEDVSMPICRKRLELWVKDSPKSQMRYASLNSVETLDQLNAPINREANPGKKNQYYDIPSWALHHVVGNVQPYECCPQRVNRRDNVRRPPDTSVIAH